MSENKNVSYSPTDGLCYDPNDELYWQQESLNKELERAFEICHGCRMCFKYCDSFPDLFRFIDENHDGDVRKLTAQETDQVMSSCFQCKLCEVQCPYTPRDSHEYQLDFPKLVHRYQAQKFRKNGSQPSLRDKLLSEPDQAGALARASLGTANLMNRNKAHRWFMEKMVGIHRDKLLPDFAAKSFSSIAKSKGWTKDSSQKVEVVLFQTCFVENNEPNIGEDAIFILEQNQVSYACVDGLGCCGMPNWEHGDWDSLKKKGMHNINLLYPYVQAGAKVAVINPTCSMMMKDEYVTLLDTQEKNRVEAVAAAIVDVAEYLWNLREEDRFQKAKSHPHGPVGYHLPCHLRAQAKGFRGRDMVKKVGGQPVKPVMECCGHDGTYAMKKEYYESSLKIGKKAFDGMKNSEGEVWVTDCPLAAIQFEQHAHVKPMHPVSFLAQCYKEDGFGKKSES